MSAAVDSYQLHVISHTHWDREWYLSHENFRLLLVDLIDHLIEIMEGDPGYRFFHLDGQTIVLEDYLEIRPAMRERLQKLITDGRVLIGPWYLQNDEYLTDGESTVRNLLIGHRMCREYGVAPMRVGYVPDQFGNIAQLPQILRGFNIETAVYGRGSEGPGKRPEYTWRGSDGSEVFAVHLFQWYNNAQRLPVEPERAVAMCREIIEAQSARAQTRHLCLMNGVDHLEAQENLASVLKSTNAAAEGFELTHSTLPVYLEAVRADLPNPPVFEGEMREGDEGAVLSGTASARIHLKLSNFHCQQTLRRWVEPFAVLARVCGSPYAAEDALDYAWKLLIQNHPHDSICGCSIDEVHFQMEARFRRVQDVINDQLRRSFRYLAAASAGEASGHHSLLTLFNANPWPETMAAEVLVDLLEGESDLEKFRLLDAEGNPVSFSVVARENIVVRVLNPKRLPKQLPLMRHRILVEAKDVPALGYRTLSLHPPARRSKADAAALFARSAEQTIRMTGSWEDESTPAASAEQKAPAPATYKKRRVKRNPRYKGQQIVEAGVTLKNEHLTATFRANGSFDLSLPDGRVYGGLHVLEDSGDRGNEYIYMKPQNDTERTTEFLDAELEVLENGPLRQAVRVTWKWNLPPEVDDRTESRPGKPVPYIVESTFLLARGQRWIELRTRLRNNVKDHRLRVLFPSGLHADHCYADAPFDIVKRAYETGVPGRNNTHPMESTVTVTDRAQGLAVFSAGMPEYEVLKSNSTICLTLLRCVDLLGDMPPTGYEKEQIVNDFTPEAQCLREYEFRYAVYPYRGDVQSGQVKHQCERFLHPLRSIQLPADKAAWAGVRPGAPKFFDYFEDEASELAVPEVGLPAEMSFLQCDNPSFVLSTVKFPEHRDRIGATRIGGDTAEAVVRFFNPGGKNETARVQVGAPLHSARRLALSEDVMDNLPADDGTIEIALDRKQVGTVSLTFGRL